jgi:hypothetical protein
MLSFSSMQSVLRRPGGVLLHPLALAAAGLLVLNDHVLKAALPGFWTGKLSDAAGLVLFPLLLVSHAELARAAAGRPRAPSARALGWALAATGLGFAAVQLLPLAGDLYRVGLGLLGWPLRAGLALATGHGLPRPAPVQLVADPSDLLALPFLAVAWRIGRARLSRPPTASGRAERTVAVGALLACAATGAMGTWTVAGLAAGPNLVLADPALPERFAIDVIVPLDALPPGGEGELSINVTAHLASSTGRARVELRALRPERPPVAVELSRRGEDVGAALPDLSVGDLACSSWPRRAARSRHRRPRSPHPAWRAGHSRARRGAPCRPPAY